MTTPAVVAAPAADGAAVLASTVTTVGPVAWITVRWKRAGIEEASWDVVGRMRSAEEEKRREVRAPSSNYFLGYSPTWTEVVAAADEDDDDGGGGGGAMFVGGDRNRNPNLCEIMPNNCNFHFGSVATSIL